MSVQRGIAKVLMRCAALLAPREKTEWLHAMRGEFEAAGDAQALSWAAGCLGTSLLWRAREEVIYVVALAAAVIAYGPYTIFVIENVIGEDAPDEYMFDMSHVAEWLYIGLATFLLCIYRPSRLLLTAIIVPLCVHIIPVVMSIWRSPLPNWDVTNRLYWTLDVVQTLSWYFGWPAALAALLAFGLNWWMRARHGARG